jgi:two-component system chemotaxis sensor kinase CheA
MDLEILKDYLAESKELLQAAQEDTLRLEAEPGNDDALASIFRAFHTIKGGAGFLEAQHLVDWAHDLEGLLDKLRSHSLPVTSVRIDGILKGIDVIEQMFRELAEERAPGPGPTDLGRTIKALAIQESANVASLNGMKPHEVHAEGRDSAAEDAASELPSLPNSPQAPHEEGAPGAHEAAPISEPFGQALARLTELRTCPSPDMPAAPPESAAVIKPPEPPERDFAIPAPTAPRGAEVAENTLRIDASRLDAVMNQVGELVLLRNRLISAVGSQGKENEVMSRIAREMDLTVNDLQNTVMRLRMQPCKRLFQQLPRVVRDVSRQLHKDVRLEIVGEDVEIDKTVVDALSAPMTHLVRNSLDHGIELPDVRAAANKPPGAVLRIAATHLGDKVRIEVSDDGKGIDRRFVTQKAIDKGVITTEQAAHLSEQEALELVFRPGFSTKEQASDLSGRGVGMDVVKETTSKLRGRLSIETHLGRGTLIAMEFRLCSRIRG